MMALASAVPAFAPAPARAAPSEAAPASEADVSYFYRSPSPERAKHIVEYFNTLIRPDKPGTEPPAIGFLAAAFRRYPGDIDGMIPEGLSATMQGIVATALRLAGQDEKARSLANRVQATGAPAPDLRYVPASLDAVTAAGPNEFDLLWGASFASGDPRYCMKILEHFATIADVDGNADDMLAVVKARASGADLHWLVTKRGAAQAQALIMQSAALWSLYSNSLQHDFVRSAVNGYLNAHPDEPASRALSALMQQYGHYDPAKVITVAEPSPGTHTATVNLAYFGQILDDLAKHAGTYPVNFQSPEDRSRAERDVNALCALLDPLAQNFSQNAAMQLRLGSLHAIGFNLDIPNSHEKADAAYSAALGLTPNDPQANYQYGAFLAATTKKGEGVPYLLKAKDLGVVNAEYWLGWSYMAGGDKAKAIEYFASYTGKVPGDGKAALLLNSLRNDKMQLEDRKSGP